MDVAGDDGLDARVRGEVAQERVPARVAALERPLQLDVEALRPEGARERDGGVRVAHAEPVAGAAGEADEPLVQLREQRQVERGRQQLAFLRAACARARRSAAGRGSRSPAATRRAASRGTPPWSVTSAPVIGADADELRRVRELERAVDAVVVGERERLVAELGRPQRQLLRVRGAVEERIG